MRSNILELVQDGYCVEYFHFLSESYVLVISYKLNYAAHEKQQEFEVFTQLPSEGSNTYELV